MNIWFSSDFHYGHQNIAGPKVSKWKEGYRDFDSVAEMNAVIVDSINSRIKRNDILYFLGDWAFGGFENIKKFRDLVVCDTIYFILGNHDHNIHKQKELFTWVKPIWEGKIGHDYFCLNHFAQRIWNHSHHGSYHLYGHSHGSLPDDSYSLSFDCGWDTELFGHEKYTPYHLDEVVHIMKNHKDYASIDHHKADVN